MRALSANFYECVPSVRRFLFEKRKTEKHSTSSTHLGSDEKRNRFLLNRKHFFVVFFSYHTHTHTLSPSRITTHAQSVRISYRVPRDPRTIYRGGAIVRVFIDKSRALKLEENEKRKKNVYPGHDLYDKITIIRWLIFALLPTSLCIIFENFFVSHNYSDLCVQSL